MLCHFLLLLQFRVVLYFLTVFIVKYFGHVVKHLVTTVLQNIPIFLSVFLMVYFSHDIKQPVTMNCASEHSFVRHLCTLYFRHVALHPATSGLKSTPGFSLCILCDFCILKELQTCRESSRTTNSPFYG